MADAAGAVHADPALYTTAVEGAESPEAPDRDGRIRPNFASGKMHEIAQSPEKDVTDKS